MRPAASLPGEGHRIAETLELVAEDGRHRFAVGAALAVEVRGADEAQGRIKLGLAGAADLPAGTSREPSAWPGTCSAMI